MRTPHTSTKDHVIPALTETPTGALSDDDEAFSSSRSDKGKARAVDPPLHSSSTAGAPSSSSRTLSPDSHLPSTTAAEDTDEAEEDDNDDDEDHCLICHTSPFNDRTVLPHCLHSQFCLSCIVRWVQIRRCCPLCLASVGEYVIHAVRGDADYLRFHLPPAPLNSASSTASASTSHPTTAGGSVVDRAAIVSRVQRARAHRDRNPPPDPTQTLEFRKYIYQHTLYAAHVGSNRHTNYRPCPNPSQIRQNGEIQRRITLFLRRELSIWPEVDAEFLTQYILSLVKVFRISDDETVRLVGEFVGAKVARHLLHELECWLRSGKQQLRFYDQSPLLQYPPRSGGRRRKSRDEVGEVGESNLASEETASAAARRTDVAKRRERLLVKLESEKRRLSFAAGACADLT
ncbi:uncharacterized protein UTRI_10362_B [Ustilago trichophora]|uniref:RING-type E3 ubiquitin transferase n=1 Tax=Ustilago trichophora TaxID=86804 RepID=A0A5C3ECM8_9BASI|nr:uncharacterized protein UTRI_10362_B [Ustilago trichophora]